MNGDSEAVPEGESYPLSWLRLSEGLIGGIHHALNNRMGALSGAAQVLEADLPAGHPLAGTMARELHRFEETAGLLRLLTGGTGDFEPVLVADVVSGSRRLFEIHHAFRDLRLDLSCQADLLPLWTQPAGLHRAILLMLAAAGDAAGSRDGEVTLAVTGDATVIEVSVVVPRRESGEEEVEAVEISAGAVESLAERLGGELELREGGGGTTWVLRMPTLPEARRREREQAGA